MREDAYSSVLSSILVSWQDDRQKSRTVEHVEFARNLFNISQSRHDKIFQQAASCQMYVLEVMAQLPTNQRFLITIFNDSTCRRHTINSGEFYKFDLGLNQNYKIKFAVTNFNGENRKTMVRSSSLIKRMMLLDRKEEESIQLNTLPLNVTEKKLIEHKGHCYTTELKITKETRRDQVPTLVFQDLLEIIRTLHEKEAMSKGVCEEYTGELSESSHFILDSIIDFHSFPHVLVPTITLSVFLVWDYSIRSFDETIIAQQIKEIRGYHVSSECSVLKEALMYLSECVEAEMSELLKRFNHLTLFPPHGHQAFKQLNSSLKTVVDACVLPIWEVDVIENVVDPSNSLAAVLKKMLVKNCLEWIEQLKTETEDVKQACLSIHAMSDLLQHNYQSASLFYHQFFIDYVRVSLETIDEKLEEVSRAYLSSRLESLNSRSSEDLELFSKCTMRIYETLASISHFAQHNNVENLRLYQYESWFQGVTVYWTFSWRELSFKMVERTISLEKDVEEGHTEQKRPLPVGIYSFLCIQKGLSDDYTTLAFNNPDNIMMATTALINIFCENTCSYGKKLYTEAMIKEEGMERRIIRAINGIEQSSDYILERWQTFVRWDLQGSKLDEREAASVLRFVKTAMDSAKQRCDHLLQLLVSKNMNLMRDYIGKIAKSITLDSAEYMKTFKSYRRDVSQLERLNSVMDSVESIVDKLRSQLLPRSFQISLTYLFDILENEIEKHLKKAQPSEYYGNLYVTIKALLDILELPISSSKLINTLHYRSFSTQELILSYFSHLSDLTNDDLLNDSSSPNVQIRIGHMKTTSANILVVVNVCQIINFPTLNPLYDRMDLYVKLELYPRVLFPESIFPAQKTKILASYQNPIWNQEFHFLIPESNFYMYGVSLCISVFDHKRICDQLLGRTFVSVTRLSQLNNTGILSSPIVSYPLLRPSIGHSHPFFQMLRDRAKYDAMARQFLSREQTAREMYVKIRRLSHKISIKKHVLNLAK